MDPVTMIAIPGLLGGIVLALIFIRLQRSQHRSADAAFRDEPLSTDVINMSRIRVAGVGGLGMVAMALAVAWAVPRIGQVLLVGLILGGALAGLLIAWRRRAGPMPSSGRHPGANATLSIDSPPARDKPLPRHLRGDARIRSEGFAPP